MIQHRRASFLVIGTLILAACLLSVVGCGETPRSSAPAVAVTATPVPATTTTTKVVVLDFLSTFQAKDPFIPQVISTTNTSTPGSQGSGTTTASRPSTSQSTTTPSGSQTTRSTTTPTSHPTQTTSGSRYLKLLSISSVNGVAVCTFEVNRVVYQDKKVGEVVSTSWGQIKVLAINTQNQTVTLQHGSETRTLSVGQQIIK